MNLRHLEVFCKVYELGSMSKAAMRLNMTQPGVSRIISEIESEYKVKLFLRKNRTLILTHKAHQFYLEAKKILNAVDILENNMSYETPQREIRVGCSTGISHHIMPSVVKVFNERYPLCRVFVEEGTPTRIQQEVKEGRFSLGFVQELIVDNEIVHKVFAHDSIIPVASPSYKTKGKSEPLSISELALEDLIMTLPTTGVRNIVEHFAGIRNVVLDPIWSTTGNNACALAEEGFGIALLSDRTVKDSIANNKLRIVAVEDFDLKRDYYQIWKDTALLSEEELYMLKLFDEYECE